jgi:hypothetical protein
VVLGVLILLVGVEGTVAYAVLTFSASVLIGRETISRGRSAGRENMGKPDGEKRAYR